MNISLFLIACTDCDAHIQFIRRYLAVSGRYTRVVRLFGIVRLGRLVHTHRSEEQTIFARNANLVNPRLIGFAWNESLLKKVHNDVQRLLKCEYEKFLKVELKM